MEIITKINASTQSHPKQITLTFVRLNVVNSIYVKTKSIWILFYYSSMKFHVLRIFQTQIIADTMRWNKLKLFIELIFRFLLYSTMRSSFHLSLIKLDHNCWIAIFISEISFWLSNVCCSFLDLPPSQLCSSFSIKMFMIF